MPLRLLIIAGIEGVLNTFLYCPTALKIARQRLNGKFLRIACKEFPMHLVLVFSEYQLDVLGKWDGDDDCSIVIPVSVLTNLCDRQQLISLMCRGELKVEGDLKVLQNFVTLISLAEFDPVELLVPYIGDIASEGISKVLHSCLELLCESIQRQQRCIIDFLTEEWRIAPGQLEMAWFAEEIVTIDSLIQTFMKRLEKLEGK